MTKTPCSGCGAAILPGTAARTGGLCMPCMNGTRETIEARKLAQEARSEPRPFQIIEQLARNRGTASNEEILSELKSLEPLADATDERWRSPSYWHEVAFLYLALCDIARLRKLRAAVPLILEKASFGDPGETMRGLRHTLEAIMAPDWRELTAVCVTALRSCRPGTRFWAMSQLLVLKDPSAAAALTLALQDEIPEIRETAKAALKALEMG